VQIIKEFSIHLPLYLGMDHLLPIVLERVYP
jgi:hypothetical protein